MQTITIPKYYIPLITIDKIPLDESHLKKIKIK